MESVQSQRIRTKPLASARQRLRQRPPAGQPLSHELIEEFLGWFAESGRKEHTVEIYRHYLNQLLEWLPDGKKIYVDTLNVYRRELLEQGMAMRTANLRINVANSLLEYLGRRELQAPLMKIEAEAQPELTRSEYLRLLSTARLGGAERRYLLVKTFGTLGLNASELTELTVEAVRQGRVSVSSGKAAYIPRCFQRELLSYAEKNGLKSGPVFVTSSGKPINRSNVWKEIAALSRDARVEEVKCNPRSLKRLCLQTKDGIRQELEQLELQMYDQLLEQEQHSIGWSASPPLDRRRKS